MIYLNLEPLLKSDFSRINNLFKYDLKFYHLSQIVYMVGDLHVGWNHHL